jgi:hypothetical protein
MLNVDQKTTKTSLGASKLLGPEEPMTGSVSFFLVYHPEPILLSSFHLEPDQSTWNKGSHLVLPAGT